MSIRQRKLVMTAKEQTRSHFASRQGKSEAPSFGSADHGQSCLVTEHHSSCEKKEQQQLNFLCRLRRAPAPPPPLSRDEPSKVCRPVASAFGLLASKPQRPQDCREEYRKNNWHTPLSRIFQTNGISVFHFYISGTILLQISMRLHYS